jgi:alpha-L-arabinofuranosidase
MLFLILSYHAIKMKNLLVIILLLAGTAQIFPRDATLSIDVNNVSGDTIPNAIYGGFIEFLQHYVNGPKGHWAQEFANRGFDLTGISESEAAHSWEKVGNPDVIWKLFPGGYNQNGIYFLDITNTLDDKRAGIKQTVFLNDSVSHTFYIYLKGTTENQPLVLTIINKKTGEIVFRKQVTIPDTSWKKYSVQIPPLEDAHIVDVYLTFLSKGTVSIDEVSLMPDNNVLGIRAEYFKFYQDWKPGLMRYPGGCYADLPQNKLEFATGPIDQRKSPNLTWDLQYQRMDFGVDEFLRFCDTLNIEPHITINFENGTVEEAVNYLEYCNGNAESKWGAKRKQNGREKPYNIKFWEVGNEQWENDSAYAHRYLEFYDAMKSKDSSTKIIIDGNHWAGYDNFRNLFSIVGNKCDIYAYHPALVGRAEEPATMSDHYRSTIGASYLYEEIFFDRINKWLGEWNLNINTVQGLSEWWTMYGTLNDWTLDTNLMNSSLESGLVCAAILSSMMKYPSSVVIGARTMGLGMIRCQLDSLSGKRNFYATPSYYALSLLRNRHGPYLIGSSVNCQTYTVPFIKGFWVLDNTPYVDATVTASEDSLFINLLNRDPEGSVNVDININKDIIGKKASVYELYSDSPFDINNGIDPFKIVPHQRTWIVSEQYTLPPHSFTIIAIPCRGIIDNIQIPAKNTGINIYPNPVSDQIRLTWDINNKKDLSIKIYSIYGKEIITTKALPDQKTKNIDINALPPGMYFITISGFGQSYFNKFIKM